jgi:plasmid stabilization system protein ParE
MTGHGRLESCVAALAEPPESGRERRTRIEHTRVNPAIITTVLNS